MQLERLAGITALRVHSERAQRSLDAFLFDPHRLALPCWAVAHQAAGGGEPALLVTLDRHFDLVPPVEPTPLDVSPLSLDTWARRQADVRNVDHILAAMECGLVSDALVVARARPQGALTEGEYLDRRGVVHRIVSAATVDALSGGLGALPEARDAAELLARASRVLLDVDLDCFTTPSDADPTTVVPWPRNLIRDFLFPRGSEGFWKQVLSKCAALTIAREPAHCGGVIAGGRLFEDAAHPLFAELLGADLP
jgi:hypothetical protein